MSRFKFMDLAGVARIVPTVASLCVSGACVAADLADLLGQYAEMQSVRVHARLLCIDDLGGTCGPASLPVPGEFEYVASGQRWRMRSTFDPSLAPEVDFETAYNGSWYQAFDRRQGMLGILVGPDGGDRGAHHPNPLFAPMQFLTAIDETNQGDLILLRSVRSAAGLLPPHTWTDVGGPQGSQERAVFPGATYEGVAYHYVVYAERGQRSTPTRIDRVSSADQSVLTTTTLSKWDPVDVGEGRTQAWPRIIMMQAFDSSASRASVRYIFTLDRLDINTPGIADGEDFSLAWDEPARVWISPPGVFLKP